MRILLYAGKGGVGKTSIAGATGIIASRKDLRTLVLSLDPAHSLSDAFDLDLSLMDKNMGRPIPIADKLWIQELDVHEEISRHWGEVHRYISVLLNASGIWGRPLYFYIQERCYLQLFTIHDFHTSLDRHTDGWHGNPQPAGQIGQRHTQFLYRPKT